MPATPFQVEAWTEYGIGVMVLLLRMFARWTAVGFKGWQGDDYFSFLSLIFWTAELVMLELIGENGTNIGISDEIAATLSQEQIDKLVFGSKCLIAGWTFYVTLIWCLKATMLFFYNRVTLGLKQQKAVKWTAAITVVGYAIILAVIWGHCTPVRRNWQVIPNPGDNCTLDVPNYLALVVVNIVTDIMIVAIPIPLLWKVQLSLKRKLLIGCLLCSGVFIMIATLLRCVLSLRDIEGINISTIWAIRETFVGIIAVNAAAIKPLFSKSRWLKSNKSSSGNKPSNGAYPGGASHGYAKADSTTQQHHQLSDLKSSARKPNNMMTDMGGDNSSEEQIISTVKYDNQGLGFDGSNVRAGSTNSGDYQDGIMVTRTYEVLPANGERRPRMEA